MKTHYLLISILGGILSVYLFGYWIYDYTDVISSPSTRLRLRFFYEPCADISLAWQARRERQQEELQFFGEWEGSLFDSVNMSVKKNGEFTMKYGDQTIHGIGSFQEIDGGLYFVVETKCQLENESQSYTQLVSKYHDISPYDEICRIKMHVFVADNPDEFQLAARVVISNLKETEDYGHGIGLLGKSSP